MTACDGATEQRAQKGGTKAGKEPGVLLVLTGDATASGSRLRVEDDSVEWFTDTPQHDVGAAGARDVVAELEKYPDFVPNAALVGDRTDAVVELTDPKVAGNGVSWRFKTLRGEVGRERLGEVTLFIDDTPSSVKTVKTLTGPG